jgi:hypothetical protein
MNEEEIKSTISEIKDTGICLVMSNPMDYRKACAGIVSRMTKDLHLNSIYVSLNMPHDSLLKVLHENSIDPSALGFIYVNNSDEKVEKEKEISLQSPSSFTELSIAISSLVSHGEYNSILFDSLSTLLMFSDIETVQKFSLFIINKIRSLNFQGSFVLIEDDKSMKLFPSISQFADQTLRI